MPHGRALAWLGLAQFPNHPRTTARTQGTAEAVPCTEAQSTSHSPVTPDDSLPGPRPVWARRANWFATGSLGWGSLCFRTALAGPPLEALAIPIPTWWCWSRLLAPGVQGRHQLVLAGVPLLLEAPVLITMRRPWCTQGRFPPCLHRSA